MTPPSPARIAAGLTWRARELIQVVPEAGAVYPPLPPACIPSDLVEHFTSWGVHVWRLTDLGRAVRAALAAGSLGAGAATVNDGDV